MSNIRAVFLFLGAVFLILFPIALKIYSRHQIIERCNDRHGSYLVRGFEVKCVIYDEDGYFIWTETAQ